MKVPSRRQTLPSDGKLAALVFLAALVIRIVYFFQIQSAPLADSLGVDAAAYDRMARQLAEGNWWGESVFYQAPFYPYFLAVLYTLFGYHLDLVRILQLVLGAVNCVVIFWIARRLFDRSTALWCAVLTLLYGILVFYEGVIGKDSLSILFTDLTLLGMVAAFQSPRWYLWLLSGAALGVSVLTRGNLILLLPVLVLWILFALRPRPLLRNAGHAACLILGAALVISPVTIRNYVVGNDFVLTTSQAGQNFYIGNNPKASGFFENPEGIRLNPQYEEADFKALALQKTGRSEMKPSEVSSFWLKEGLRFIRENPERALALLAKKTAMFWNHFEIPDNYNYYFFKEQVSILPVLFVGFGLVAPLGLVGFALTRGRPLTWLFLLFVLGYMASIVPFHMASRYRLAVVPVLILFGGYTANWFVDRLVNRNVKGLLIAVFSVAVLAVGVNWPVVDEKETFKTPYTEMGIAATERGDFEEAYGFFQRALEIDPTYTPALYNMGNALAEQGRYEAAVAAYEKAIRKDPDLIMAYDNLGKSYLRLGRPDKAMESFNTVLDIRPDFVGARVGKGLVYHVTGNFDKAVSVYREALEFQPDYGPAYYNLACAYARSGRVEEAKSAIRKAIALDETYRSKALVDRDLKAIRSWLESEGE